MLRNFQGHISMEMPRAIYFDRSPSGVNDQRLGLARRSGSAVLSPRTSQYSHPEARNRRTLVEVAHLSECILSECIGNLRIGRNIFEFPACQIAGQRIVR